MSKKNNTRRESRKKVEVELKPLAPWQKTLYIVYTAIWAIFPFIVMPHPQWSQIFGYLGTSKPYLILHFFPVLTVLMIFLWPHTAGKRERVFAMLFFIFGVFGFWYNPFTVVIAAVTEALSGVTLSDMAARIISEIIMIAVLFFAIYILYIGNAWRNEIIERKEAVDKI